jgi:hypothetical protein
LVHSCFEEELLIVKLDTHWFSAPFCLALVDKHLSVSLNDEASLALFVVRDIFKGKVGNLLGLLVMVVI